MNQPTTTVKDRAILLARDFLVEEEGVALFAYPDPMSPLGKALTKEFGPKGIMRICTGGQVPKHLSHLSGNPWTNGYGATGADIAQGTKWSLGQAKDRLAKDLEKYYRLALKAWPGMDNLHELAQAALISLAYNRGTDMQKSRTDELDRRLEMRELVLAVADKDYQLMAKLIRSMARLWENKNLGGLVARRKAEAQMCENAFMLTKG